MQISHFDINLDIQFIPFQHKPNCVKIFPDSFFHFLCKPHSWCSFSLWETSQTLFWAIFGLIDLENFELTGIKERKSNQIVQENSSYQSAADWTLDRPIRGNMVILPVRGMAGLGAAPAPFQTPYGSVHLMTPDIGRNKTPHSPSNWMVHQVWC